MYQSAFDGCYGQYLVNHFNFPEYFLVLILGRVDLGVWVSFKKIPALMRIQIQDHLVSSLPWMAVGSEDSGSNIDYNTHQTPVEIYKYRVLKHAPNMPKSVKRNYLPLC